MYQEAPGSMMNNQEVKQNCNATTKYYYFSVYFVNSLKVLYLFSVLSYLAYTRAKPRAALQTLYNP